MRRLAVVVALAGCAAPLPAVSSANIVSHEGVEVILHTGPEWSAPIGANGKLEVSLDDALAWRMVLTAVAVPDPAPSPPQPTSSAASKVWLTVAEVVVKRRDPSAVVLSVIHEMSHVVVNGSTADLLPTGARVRFELSR